MFVVDNILVSDEVLNAPFACHLGSCLGGCCVQGDAGAPLEADERDLLEQALPKVRHYLRPEALAVIDEHGVWEEIRPGHYTTTCVNGAECVFVTYEGEVAKCALQRVYVEGGIDFPKPLSCHLYPIRIQKSGTFDILNYEQISLCDSARQHGHRTGTQLVDFLRSPLIRKYGESWFEQFREAALARRSALEQHIGHAADL
jgi:hypothetical protein